MLVSHFFRRAFQEENTRAVNHLQAALAFAGDDIALAGGGGQRRGGAPRPDLNPLSVQNPADAREIARRVLGLYGRWNGDYNGGEALPGDPAGGAPRTGTDY